MDRKLSQNPLPLYLTGLDYLIPLFQQSSKYSLLQEGHLGRLKGKSQNEIHKKVWELAEGHFLKEKNKRKEEFGFWLSKRLAIAGDTSKLIKAAVTGGVDTLLVNSNHKHLWGTYDSDGFSVDFQEEPDGKNHCLIDLAAVKVLEAGGRVFMLPPEEMPEKTLVAGTRYEMS